MKTSEPPYTFRRVFLDPAEEESFAEATGILRIRTAIAQLQQIAGQLRVRIDFDALLHNLRAEIAASADVEAELELTFPSERSPELQGAARALAYLKAAARLTEAAAAFVRVYDDATTPRPGA